MGWRKPEHCRARAPPRFPRGLGGSEPVSPTVSASGCAPFLPTGRAGMRVPGAGARGGPGDPPPRGAAATCSFRPGAAGETEAQREWGVRESEAKPEDPGPGPRAALTPAPWRGGACSPFPRPPAGHCCAAHLRSSRGLPGARGGRETPSGRAVAPRVRRQETSGATASVTAAAAAGQDLAGQRSLCSDSCSQGPLPSARLRPGRLSLSVPAGFLPGEQPPGLLLPASQLQPTLWRPRVPTYRQAPALAITWRPLSSQPSGSGILSAHSCARPCSLSPPGVDARVSVLASAWGLTSSLAPASGWWNDCTSITSSRLHEIPCHGCAVTCVYRWMFTFPLFYF